MDVCRHLSAFTWLFVVVLSVKAKEIYYDKTTISDHKHFHNSTSRSTVECGMKCYEFPECFGFDYSEAYVTCRLYGQVAVASYDQPPNSVKSIYKKDRSCPELFEKVYNVCYYRTSMMSWKDAKSYCKEKGGKIAEPRTKSVMKALGKWLPGVAVIGALKKDDGTLLWISDDTPVSYDLWLPNEPSNLIEKNVIVQGATGLPDRGWNDIHFDSTKKLNVVCEF